VRRNKLRHHSFHLIIADLYPRATQAAEFDMLSMEVFPDVRGEVVDRFYVHD
jgi:hypothetical protein